VVEHFPSKPWVLILSTEKKLKKERKEKELR
jgi:hypothetical protein